MNLKEATFCADKLTLVASAESFRDSRGSLCIGDSVALNSGGPRSLVVDTGDKTVTIAWRDLDGGVRELDLPRPCVHRVS
jgi:uncharacterized protein YodC (DUF2158 family)